MYQGTKTRKPRRLMAAGNTTVYQRRKPSLLARTAFTAWALMANILEALAVLTLLIVIVLACLLVPLVLWF